MDNFSAITILAVVAVAVWWWLRRSSGTSGQAETQLRRVCFGDDGQVERLINGEMTRCPLEGGGCRSCSLRDKLRRYCTTSYCTWKFETVTSST